MTNATDHLPCLSLADATRGLKDRYLRLALVSHERHLDGLDASDEDTLVVSCDWLLWQKARTEGWHCIHSEWGILKWDKADLLHQDLRIRAADWVYVEGRDATVFQGVSLGKLFVPQTLTIQAAIIRVERMLGPIIEKFQPAEMIYFDCRAETNYLDSDQRRSIALSIARERGLEFLDRSDPVDPTDGSLPFSPGGANVSESSHRQSVTKQCLLAVYARILDVVGRMTRRFGKRKRNVLLFMNTSLSIPLIKAYNSEHIRPVLLSRSQPKTIGFLKECLTKGVLLVTPTWPRLSKEERQQIRKIIGVLDLSLATSSAFGNDVIHDYVRKRFLNERYLFGVAAEVKKAQSVLENNKISRLIIDGVSNALPRVYVDSAHHRSIPVDYIWHSPWVPERFKVDALGGDPRSASHVDRCLSWGRSNDQWLDIIGAKCGRARTGCPIGAPYRAPASGRERSGQRRALVVEYNVSPLDLAALNGIKYFYFINVIRLLKELEYEDVVFKIHPGPPRQEYYEKMAAHFGIDCDIVKYEPFRKFLVGSDIVIGPAHSGAMPEALAAGKPYYGLMIPPTSMDFEFYRGLNVLTDIDQLKKALAEAGTVDSEQTLESFYAFSEIPDPCARFWEVMEGDRVVNGGVTGDFAGDAMTSPT
jgi:hypothetical protein